MAYLFQKHFTLEEARALLPELRAMFRDVHRRRDVVQKADAELGKKLKQTGAEVGGEKVSGLLMDMLQLNVQLRRLQEMGIQIKDFERGLLDFPHLRDGREVFLCWELDENDIEFWHDIDSGYAGRERL
ncbi:MAG TPA: DUF2203 domain-containing protein [Verrucomicrobiae bacterium]|nr:DUF2203 domain-containing protein [Verrucomicrobiae bacterium]